MSTASLMSNTACSPASLGHIHPVPQWYFIDRQTYAELKESRHSVTTAELKDLFDATTSAGKKLSETARQYVSLVNSLVKYVLFSGPTPNGIESDYLLKQVKRYLSTPQETMESFYEILPADDSSVIVVVDRGFLYHVTQSKSNLIGYTLACLRCLDRFNCDASQINELYLRLHYVKGYELLTNVRAQG